MILAVVLSAAIGVTTGVTLRFVEARWEVETPSVRVLTLVMAVVVLGACRVVEANGVLGVFVAGLAYSAVTGMMEREEQEALDEVANRYVILPFFLLVGVILPWQEWGRIGGDVVLFAVAVIVLRRLPIVVALARPLGLRLRDALFVGWFGPLGASSVFYLAFSLEEGATDPRVFALGMAVVTLSTVVHGVSAIPLRKLYARAGS